MYPPTIRDYYDTALEDVRAEVQRTPDDRALGMNTDEWVAYLVARREMEPINARLDAMTMEETSLNGYPAVLVTVPVEPSDTFDVIAKQGLAGQAAWLGFDYRTFFSSSRRYTLGQATPPDTGNITTAKRRITEYVASLNSAIEHENKTFPDKVRQIVTSRQEGIRAKHQNLDALSKAVGIPLVKRADVSTVVPTAVRVKKRIAALVPPTPRTQERPVLERDKFDAIVELIDNQGRQFERTPTVFQQMGEEAIRDIILGSLNAVFEGAAVGEAFQGLGKTDIHLRISKGEVFSSEVKIWDGPASLAKVVAQVLDRLTWRDGFGVAVVLAKNADFGQVLQAIEATLPELPGVVKASVRKDGASNFVARFSLPSDPSTTVEIHVRAYNLYTPRQSGRTS